MNSNRHASDHAADALSPAESLNLVQSHPFDQVREPGRTRLTFKSLPLTRSRLTPNELMPLLLDNALRAQIAQLLRSQAKQAAEHFVAVLADGGRIMMDAGWRLGHVDPRSQ